MDKPYLLGTVGSLQGHKLVLDANRLVIGRDANQCQLVIPHQVVSRRHALLETDEQGNVTISDLGSSQGTFVNGAQVTSRQLHPGDQVGFGPGGVLAFSFVAASQEAVVPQAAPAPRAEALRAQLLSGARQAGTGTVPAAGLPPPPAAPRTRTPVEAPILRLGRAPDNDIVLDSPGVSRHHATLDYSHGAQPVIADTGSTNGTYVNGKPLRQPRTLSPEDLVLVGGFLLRVSGRDVRQYDLGASRITAWELGQQIEGRAVLKDVSMAISGREFVGLMGPSGCGKSTLMDALNGLRPASSGGVFVNDLDLYRNFEALRRSIGYVPQRDVLHDVLSVERTLYYSAKLRLPEEASHEQLLRTVDEVIGTIGLEEQRQTQFKNLSGGQQKRLSLGLELLTKPSFLFLDEPTSPLDPETTENMMDLFRKLADEGRIVVMVTHKFEKFDLMHQVAILTRGGRLAFFGPPREALTYFGCQEPSDIYRRIGARDPDELCHAFEASPQYQRYVQDRIDGVQEAARLGGPEPASPSTGGRASTRRGVISQWITLTQRYLEVKLKDRRNTFLLLAQAPVVALILATITGSTPNDAKTLFIAAIIAIWFGANNAVREIVAELPIYTRERLVNLRIPSYVLSKYVVLAGIALIQCLLFIGILVGMGRLNGADFGWLTAILYLTSLGGVTMGLFFSALVNTAEKAMSVLPLLLIPQLLLSGFLKPLDDVYVNARTGKPATVDDYKRFEDAKDKPAPDPATLVPGQPLPAPPDPVTKSDGLGGARWATAPMLARWSMEGLAHTVSIGDSEARDKLAARMTVEQYRKVLAERPEDETTAAYREHVRMDLAILGFFNLLFLGLAMGALRRKDVL